MHLNPAESLKQRCYVVVKEAKLQIQLQSSFQLSCKLKELSRKINDLQQKKRQKLRKVFRAPQGAAYAVFVGERKVGHSRIKG